MEFGNLLSEFEQDGFSQQILQKLIQVDGDIKMNRNYSENIRLLGEWSFELTGKIAKAMDEGAKYKGFIELRKVCEILISEIFEKLNVSDNV